MDNIIQIIPITKPLVAVFRVEEEEHSILTEEIVMAAIIEDEDGVRSVVGLSCADYIDTCEEAKNFIGYAPDRKTAIELWGKSTTPQAALSPASESDSPGPEHRPE